MLQRYVIAHGLRFCVCFTLNVNNVLGLRGSKQGEWVPVGMLIGGVLIG